MGIFTGGGITGIKIVEEDFLQDKKADITIMNSAIPAISFFIWRMQLKNNYSKLFDKFQVYEIY